MKNKKLTVIRNEVLLKRLADNHVLSRFLENVNKGINIFTDTEMLDIIRILVERELRRKR